ncbi:MAG TPA: dTDP-4-dehydrorhamnose 3,5-epimerase [Candidatus Sulfotelmatobacter sp.]|nr:dTDP-4-dehydrorhamnose 3,5-epimerase [Candidatus Sulfotelmatobacter sp.]
MGIEMVVGGVKVTQTSIPELLILEPRVFGDERGFFMETYNERVMSEIGIKERFVQDNHSCSARNVLRGLHYQIKQPQGKLVRVVEGEVLDVAVDLRRLSKTFGQWEAVRLSGENKRMFWIPAGFAHGFSVLSEKAHVLYKATDFYTPEHERTLAWNDPDVKIDWEVKGNPIISPKDQRGATLKDADTFD